MKPTKEEIDLLKQIAEKHRKPIEYGDWYWHEIDEDVFLHSTKEKYPYVADAEHEYIIPLWTIFDCLEFLNKRGVAIENLHQPGWKNWSILIKHVSVLHIKDAKWTGKELEIRSNKTPLEACLKAVLAVLEEKK